MGLVLVVRSVEACVLRVEVCVLRVQDCVLRHDDMVVTTLARYPFRCASLLYFDKYITIII